MLFNRELFTSRIAAWLKVEFEKKIKNQWFKNSSLWAVVNLNSNRTCPVCTGLIDNSVYWPDPMVQYVALTRLTYDRGQFSLYSPVGGLWKLPLRVHTFYSTRPNPRPIWLTPLCPRSIFTSWMLVELVH